MLIVPAMEKNGDLSKMFNSACRLFLQYPRLSIAVILHNTLIHKIGGGWAEWAEGQGKICHHWLVLIMYIEWPQVEQFRHSDINRSRTTNKQLCALCSDLLLYCLVDKSFPAPSSIVALRYRGTGCLDI